MRIILTTESDRVRALEAIQGAELGLMVTIIKPPRTAAQNRFYWALLTACSEQLVGGRYSQEIWHQWAKSRFLGSEMIELPNGQPTELNTESFTNYVEQILAYALEKGLIWTDEMKDSELDLVKLGIRKR
jgi:hypothetical protein